MPVKPFSSPKIHFFNNTKPLDLSQYNNTIQQYNNKHNNIY